jgi:hypothetical protein
MKLIKQILAGIGVIFVLLVTVWQSFDYLGKYALGAEVDKKIERVDKQIELIQQENKKQMEILEKKSNKMEQYFDLKFLQAELKQVREQIEQMERDYGMVPKDQVKRADLERLKRKREELLIEQGGLKERK